MLLFFQIPIFSALAISWHQAPGYALLFSRWRILPTLPISPISSYLRSIDLGRCVRQVSDIRDTGAQALACCREVMEAMARVRSCCDALEDLVSKEPWPDPSYGNLLYRV